MRPGAPAGRVPRRADVAFHAVTPERWPDLERLFGPNGAYSNCWCTYWMLPRKRFDEGPPSRKKALLRGLVDEGREPGVLAYRDREPVGWVAVQPREAYASLERSPTLKRVDDEPVWSVTCFFVRKDHRRTGLMVPLLETAARHAKARGARILEGYPVLPKEGLKPPSAYMGLVPAFERAGFREVARPSAARRVMRKTL